MDPEIQRASRNIASVFRSVICPALLLATAVSISGISVHAQVAPATYWVGFANKPNAQTDLQDPTSFLSERSLSRRLNQQIALTEEDAPVHDAYVQAVRGLGDVHVLHRSKWFNGITIESTDTAALLAIAQLPFVMQFRMGEGGTTRTKRGQEKFPLPNATIGGNYESMYGPSFRQVSMMNVHLLHEAGLRGEGVLIGVLDSGFQGVDVLPAFTSLRQRNGIRLTADIVTGDGDVFGDHWHGRSVLSVMAADLPGSLIGTAPAADYVLLRTENADTEYVVEEYHWVRGAEICDSIGCDVLNTSLGYTTFDDSLQDHTYEQLDGATTRISRGASMAAQRGMVVVNSAGNSGSSAWYNIGAPADAADILAVGAVGADRNVASFSSHGPSSDGRIKPEVSAMGWGTYGLDFDGLGVVPINGTSFSSPLVAGAVACLWQADPSRSAVEIREAVIRSASHFIMPNNDIGHGIPDLWRGRMELNTGSSYDVSTTAIRSIFPVPLVDHLWIDLLTGAANTVEIALFDILGRPVVFARSAVDPNTFQRLWLGDVELRTMPAGTYVLRVVLGDIVHTRSVIKEGR